MASNIKENARNAVADVNDTVREAYSYTNPSGGNYVISQFDNLSGSDYLHDQVDLTSIFDQLGGLYSDGQNDLQDRINAVNLSFGDYDGDGRNNDVRLTINGLSGFSLTFVDPASPYKGGFDIGTGLASMDDIAVMSYAGANAPTGNTTQTLAAGNNIFFADPAGQATNKFVATSAGTGLHTIRNFDSNASDGSHDQLDLSQIFDNLGGRFADPTNGFANREAAVNITTGDFDGDGKSDVRVTIDGVHNFSVNLLGPSDSSSHAFTAAASGSSANLILGGGVGASGTTVTAPPAAPASSGTSVVVSSDTGTKESSMPSTNSLTGTSSALFKGQFPANYARLDNGINIERSEFNHVSLDDLKYLKSIGVENVRIILNMDDGWGKLGQPIDPNTNSYFSYLKGFMDKVVDAGLAVVIDPMGNRPAFLTNPGDTKSINDTIAFEKTFASWIAHNYHPQDVFIEPFNEPFMAQSEDWWNIQGKLIAAVHSVAPDFGVIAMSNGRDVDLSNQWDFIKSMVHLQPYDDPNVAYSIHYYSPMTFTHQGASWVPMFANVSNNHWPGTEGMTPATIESELTVLKNWADHNGVFVTIDEYGVMNTVAQAEKAAWLTDLTKIFDKLGFGFDVWELNKAFSISTTDGSGHVSIPEIYQAALGLGSHADASNFDWNGATGTTTTTGGSSVPTGSTSTSSPPPTSTGTSGGSSTSSPTSFTADAAFAKNETFVLSALDLNKTVTITNFDSISGQEKIKDAVDLHAVFDALGGKFTDGVNDFADRKAALQFTVADLDHDGKANDLQINIQGASGFHLNLIHPDATYSTAYDIGDGHGVYDNILIA